MKQPIQFSRTAVILGLIAALPWMLAHHNGVAEEQDKDRTGAPGSSPPCSNTLCHDDAAYDPTFTIEVIDLNTDLAIEEYIPETTYGLRFSVSAPGSIGSGFQATALLNSDDSNAGQFQNPGTKVQLEDVDGRHIVEHSNSSISGIFEAEWVAPGQGSGDVTFYGSCIAANSNQESSGDGYAGNTLLLSEGNPDHLAELSLNASWFYNGQSLQLESEQAGEISVFSSSGRRIYQSETTPGMRQIRLNEKGILLVIFESNGQLMSGRILAF